MARVVIYHDESVKVSRERAVKDIYRDLAGIDDSHTYNLQGLYDYGNGVPCGETRNEGLSTRRCGLTSELRVYRVRCARAKEARMVAKELRNVGAPIEVVEAAESVAIGYRDGFKTETRKARADLHTMAYLYDEYKHTL